MYNKTFLSKEELVEKTEGSIFTFQLNRLIGAYEMCENALYGLKGKDGQPLFFHSTRCCKILLDELKLKDTDMLISSLLYNVLLVSDEINHSILLYNFGTYVTFLIETITEDIKSLDNDEHEVSDLLLAGDDGLILRLAELLDEFRCLEYNLELNPIQYVTKISDRYFGIAEKSRSSYISYLLNELKKERNKLFQ